VDLCDTALTWAGAVWSLLILGILGLGLWGTSVWIFQTKGIFISSLVPLITLASNFSLLTLLKYRQEEQKGKGPYQGAGKYARIYHPMFGIPHGNPGQ